MDISAAAMVQATLDMRSAGAEELAQVTLLKKVMQTEQDMMSTLLQSIPTPSANGTGRKLDYYA